MTTNDMEQRIAAVEEAMRGDLKGNPGVLQNLIRVMNDVYHPEEGLKPRMKLLEMDKVRASSWVSGATWMAKAVWVAVGGAIGYWIKQILGHTP